MEQKIYILLPVHNRKNITIDFVNCLKNQNYKNYELLLIDDGSTDGTAESVKKQLENLSVINGNGNLWWAGSLNAGINYLKERNVYDEDIVLIINDDVLINDTFLSTGAGLINAMKNTLLLAQFRNENTGKIEETGINADLVRLRFNIAASKEQINCLSTRGLFSLWGTIKKIGLLKPVLLPHYGSDYEFTIRAFKLGFRLTTDPSLVIVNNHDHTGIRQMIVGTFKERIKCLFSRRYVMNPIYWTNFVFLICPWYAIAPNIIKVWVREMLSLFRAGKSIHNSEKLA
ncbi:MAG: glycosyltransferase family 2 protein [Gammaproteobacteria bacterium]|jgi:GT2 family glycosyltransferase